jgi:hypothetical protein
MDSNHTINMGHGQLIDIVATAPDTWELKFRETERPDEGAPPLADIRVEAVDSVGAIHALTVSAGPNRHAVLAKGSVAGAYRARVMVMHGDHFHSREAFLPGKSAIAPSHGPSGGALVAFPEGAVEAKLVSPEAFELVFAGTTPTPESIKLQAIGPRAENFQVRNLNTRAGDRAGTLVAEGKIKDATYLRVTLASGASRSVPIVR